MLATCRRHVAPTRQCWLVISPTFPFFANIPSCVPAQFNVGKCRHFHRYAKVQNYLQYSKSSSKKPLRLLENTTDVVFPRREFVQLYRGTLSPPPKQGCFWSPQVVHSVVFTTFFFVRVFLMCTTVTAKSVTSYQVRVPDTSPPIVQ